MAEAAQVGLDKFHCAEVLTDTTAGCSYDTPVAITGMVAADVKANGSIETNWADDGPAENISSVGRQEASLEFTNLPLSRKAWLLGHAVTNGVVRKSVLDSPKVVAIGYRSMKSNGHYRYIWHLKGQFALPDTSAKTKTDKTSFNNLKMNYVGLRRDYDNEYQFEVDDDDPAVPESVITNWFNAVPVTIAAPDALTVTPVPADAATAVVVSSNLTWTFNNVINLSQVTAANFFALKASDGTVVAGTLSLDATGKIVTLNPTANLAAATAYIAICSNAVRDVYGQSVVANTITNFTTA